MRSKRYTCLLIPCMLFILAMASSCQKDNDVQEPAAEKTKLSADSSAFSSPGNFLAASGTLNVKFNDSVYTFDAAKDSIAFITVRVDDNTRYFGITAINKDHNLSFGISSAGFVYSNLTRSIAGGQFLLSSDGKKPAMQLSLSKYSSQKDFGNIDILQYHEGSELAKGTFYTFLAKDDKANSPYYKVEGTFDLKLK